MSSRSSSNKDFGIITIFKARSLKTRRLPFNVCRSNNLALLKMLKKRAKHILLDAQRNGVFSPGTEEDLSCSVLETSVTDCYASKILAYQSNFANEKPLLQMVTEEAAHICLFLPKFHCKLNPIKLFWSYIENSELFVFISISRFTGEHTATIHHSLCLTLPCGPH